MPNVVVVPFDALMGDNHRLIPARGRQILNPKYRDAKEALRLRMKAHRPRIKMHEKRVSFQKTFYWPDHRKRDIANYTKFLHDTFTGIAYIDDVQIVFGSERLGGFDRANPRVEIVIEEAA